MLKVSVVASSVVVLDEDPDVLAVGFMCEAFGPYNFIGLERAYQPAPGDERYARGNVSVDVDLRPLAHPDSTPGAVIAIRIAPGRIELSLCRELDPEMGDLRTIEIRFNVDEARKEWLNMVLQLLFEGTAVAPVILA